MLLPLGNSLVIELDKIYLVLVRAEGLGDGRSFLRGGGVGGQLYNDFFENFGYVYQKFHKPKIVAFQIRPLQHQGLFHLRFKARGW